MIARLKTGLVAGAVWGALSFLGGLGLAGTASAMPVLDLQNAPDLSVGASRVDTVRLICPPYRPCYHVPGFYGYPRAGFYGPGFYRPGFYRPYRHRYFY